MIKISEEIKKLYIEDSTPIELEVRFNDNAFPTIKGSDVLSEQMTLHESICEEEQLKFGGCNASSFELTIFNLNSGIKGYEIEPVLITNKTEIPLGVFYVETIEKYAGKDYKKLTAYDKMRYFDVDVKDWYDNLTFPISVKNFRDSLCEYVGVEQNEVTLIADNIMLTKELDSSNGINGLSLMKQICEISGVFGRMDRYGKFDYLSLESSMLLPADDLFPANDLYPSAGSESSENSFNISTSLMYEHPLVEDFFTSNIDGVIIVDSEGAQVLTEYNQNPYYVQDNFVIMGQTHETIMSLANALLSKISSISYRPINSSKIKGQPYVECGDFISGEVNGYGFEAYVFQRDLTGIKALRDAYICKGKEMLENDMNGVTATLQRLNSSIGKTKVTIEKTEKGLRGEISQSLEESKKYTDNSSSATLESANNYAQDAAQGALNAANNNTNEKLKSYYTKEENDNQFDATARGFTAQISSTKEELKKYTDSSASSTLNSANSYTDNSLTSYVTEQELTNTISITSEGFNAEIKKQVSETKSYADSVASAAEKNAVNYANSYTYNSLGNYTKKEVFQTAIDATNRKISTEVSRAKSEEEKLSSKITETAETIKTEVSQTYETINNADSRQEIIQSSIEQASSEIVLKVDANGKIVQVALTGDITKGTEFKVNADNINLSASDVINLLANGNINLTGKNITITSTNFNVDKDGNVTANNLMANSGTFKGNIESSNANITGGNITLVGSSGSDGRLNIVFGNMKMSIAPSGVSAYKSDGTRTIFVTSSNGGYIQLGGGTISLSGASGDIACHSVIQTSDKELKKDIESLGTESSDFIYSLRPVKYRFKENQSDRYHHGLIAQEVKESMGDDDWGLYVDKNIETGESGGKALRYEELIADLVATVQSQNERIAELEKKLGGR